MHHHDQHEQNRDPWAATVRQAQAKDSAALLRLLDEFENVIRSATRRFHLPEHERGDLLQEAYMGFLKAVFAYDPARGGFFAGYAKAKTREAVWQYIRVRNRTKSRELADLPASDDEGEGVTLLDSLADPQAEDAFSESEWRHMLASLSPREALGVEQIVIDGRTMVELARLEGVSPETVKTWKKRAFQKMRALLNR